jgi:hypothetical protein
MLFISLNLPAGGFTGFNVEGFLPGERVAFQRAYTTFVLFYINRYFNYYVGDCVKILTIDDSKQIRFMLQRLLERWRYEVITACNGMEAWQYIQRESTNLIISDWVMPQMDGLELCRRLRANDFVHYVSKTLSIFIIGHNARVGTVGESSASHNMFP